mmetsp:Transcript_74046/g.233875  ORF Transcript_74046/g.233875 Transcript_74046/m.233875 type:complete len:232 (-) Transcript_74046:375-1070(-)
MLRGRGHPRGAEDRPGLCQDVRGLRPGALPGAPAGPLALLPRRPGEAAGTHEAPAAAPVRSGQRRRRRSIRRLRRRSAPAPQPQRALARAPGERAAGVPAAGRRRAAGAGQEALSRRGRSGARAGRPHGLLGRGGLLGRHHPPGRRRRQRSPGCSRGRGAVEAEGGGVRRGGPDARAGALEHGAAEALPAGLERVRRCPDAVPQGQEAAGAAGRAHPLSPASRRRPERSGS